VILTVFFFYCDGIIHHEFLPLGQTVNKEYYLKVINRLREAVRRKRPHLWRGEKRVALSLQYSGTFLLSDS
jgi:hypothetical protein